MGEDSRREERKTVQRKQINKSEKKWNTHTHSRLHSNLCIIVSKRVNFGSNKEIFKLAEDTERQTRYVAALSWSDKTIK